jgi:hypothetical protein
MRVGDPRFPHRTLLIRIPAPSAFSDRYANQRTLRWSFWSRWLGCLLLCPLQTAVSLPRFELAPQLCADTSIPCSALAGFVVPGLGPNRRRETGARIRLYVNSPMLPGHMSGSLNLDRNRN